LRTGTELSYKQTHNLLSKIAHAFLFKRN